MLMQQNLAAVQQVAALEAAAQAAAEEKAGS